MEFPKGKFKERPVVLVTPVVLGGKSCQFTTVLTGGTAERAWIQVGRYEPEKSLDWMEEVELGFYVYAQTKTLRCGPVLVSKASVTIGKELGRGAFGVVHKGEWKGKDVAVKKLAVRSQEELREFMREAYMFQKTRSAYCVRLYAICAEPAMFVMECMDHSLDALIRQGGYKAHDVERIASQLACGGQYLHGLVTPLLHRDIKPANIMLTKDNSVAKLSDFGISRMDVTLTMSVAGTPLYMAPEVVSSCASDVYAYGLTMVELARGELFNRKDNIVPMKPVLRPNGSWMIPVGNAAPYMLELLTECVRPDPTKRWTFAQIAKHLQKK